MKTSVIEVRGMLSALSAHGVEKRIGKVPGVESVTVNYVAGSATVRYDDTRLEIADIKAAVHHCGYQCAGESLPRHVSDRNPAHKRALVPTPEAAPASASPPVAAVAKASPGRPRCRRRAGCSGSRRRRCRAGVRCSRTPPPPCQRRPLLQSPVTRATRRRVPSRQRP